MRGTIALVALLGCGHSTMQAGGDDGPPPVPPDGWAITIDTSQLDRYVVPETATSWTVAGTATATAGLAGVTVAGTSAGSPFSVDVPVTPGLTRVPIVATDNAGHTRKGDRTLLETAFLPDNALNPGGAGLVLDNHILGSLAIDPGTVDIAGQILAMQYLSNDSQCTTWPTGASQGAVQVALTQASGVLTLTITVPDLDVQFGGECQGIFTTIPIAGEMSGSVVIATQLTAQPDGGCLHAFAHTTPAVAVDSWSFDVWGVGGPLQDWLVELFSGQKGPQAEAQLIDQVGAQADAQLDTKLANISVFDHTSSLTMLGQDVSLHLCVGDVQRVGGKLVATIASATTSAGTRMAPGAPQIDGAMPAVPAKELVLDGNLVGQLLFASWRAGGLSRPAPDVDASIFYALVPELAQHYSQTTAQIAIDAELPPLVRATATGTGNLSVELGDVMVDVSLGGDRVMRFDVGLTLSLDLKPVDGKLAPTVVDTQATVALVDERYDGPDDALEQAVQAKIGDTAASLLGDAAAIALPPLPGLGKPTKVTADKGGRYLHVTLE